MNRPRFSKEGSFKYLIGKPGRPAVIRLLLCLFVIVASTGLAGCGKNCEQSNAEIESYITGAVPYKNADKLKEKCLKILDKCPNLSSPYEFMGDLEIKGKRLEQGLEYFQKALKIDQKSKRIQDKIVAVDAIIEAQKELAAAERMKKMLDMPLSEYVKLEESVRLEWCENRLSVVDSGMDQINRTTPSFKAEVDLTPSRLDYYLREASVSNPDGKTGDAALTALMKSTRMRAVRD